MNATPAYQLITSTDQLRPVLAALERVPEVALDTEADNLFHYRTRLCLLQLRLGDEIFLVDLLAPLPLGELWRNPAAKPMIMYENDDLIAIASEEVSLNRLFPGKALDTREPPPGSYDTWSRST